MTPELSRTNSHGVEYENKALHVKRSFYPLNYHFFPDNETFPVEVDCWNRGVRDGIQVGETSVICYQSGFPVGGDFILYVEEHTQYVSAAHQNRVSKK